MNNVKIFYGRKGKLIRYCQVDDYTTLDEFKESIVRVFPELGGSKWRMYWFDDEDDKIMINDETSHDCFQDSDEIKKKVYVERIKSKGLRRHRRKCKKSTPSIFSTQKFLIPNCTRCKMEKSTDFRATLNDFNQFFTAYNQIFIEMLDKMNITEKEKASNTATNQAKSDYPTNKLKDILENDPKLRIFIDKQILKEKSNINSLPKLGYSRLFECTTIKQPTNALNENATITPQLEEENEASIEPKVKYIYHKKPHIENAVIAMSAMGYNNEGNWLTPLLESVDGDVPKALNRLKLRN